METPFFSVIIPTYNRSAILNRAINSVLKQTFHDFELIIVDDGSTDNTRESVISIADKRIVYLYKENGGQNSANNIGIKRARGEVIAFLDSDDYWLPRKLEMVYRMYQQDAELGVVYHWTGAEKDGEIVLARRDGFEGWCYSKVLKAGYLTSPTFLTCKRECFDRIGLLDEDISFCQDDDLCFSLCKYYKVGLVKEILGVYDVMGDDQMTKSYPSITYLKSEMTFLRKWQKEVISNCGGVVMMKRYMKCLTYYLELGEIELADEVYELAKKCIM